MPELMRTWGLRCGGGVGHQLLMAYLVSPSLCSSLGVVQLAYQTNRVLNELRASERRRQRQRMAPSSLSALTHRVQYLGSHLPSGNELVYNLLAPPRLFASKTVSGRGA